MTSKFGLDKVISSTDRFNDIRIKRLKRAFGCNGICVYDFLICEIHKAQGFYIELSDDLIFIASDYFCVEEDDIKNIIDFCVSVKLFDADMYKQGILTSESIQQDFNETRKVCRKNPVDIDNFFAQNDEEIVQECTSTEQNCTKDSVYNIDFVQKHPSTTHLLYKNNAVETQFCTKPHNFCANEQKNDEINKEKKVTKEKKYIKKISTDVDIKESSPSPSTIKQEVEFLKGEEIWLSNLQMLHRLDVNALKNRLDDFVVQCIADGKTSHASIQDAKQHFNSWLRIKLNNSNNYANIQQQNNRRRGSEITATSAEDYKTPF